MDKTPETLTHSYRIQNAYGAKGFRITKFQGPKYIGTVRSNGLDQINRDYKAGRLSRDEARREVEQVQLQLKRNDGLLKQGSRTNLEVLERFWNAKYRNRELIDRETMYCQYRRAIIALDKVNIVTATQDEMQTALNDRYVDHRQRQLATALNSILTWLGRSDSLVRKRRKLPVQIQYLTFEDAEKAFKEIRITEKAAEGRNPIEVAEAFRVLCRMAMFTGCRISELFGLEPRDRTDAFIHIRRQITKYNECRAPKRGKTRRVAPFPQGMVLYSDWMLAKDLIPLALRRRASKILKDACAKAFPDKPHLWIRFHSLRHSYANACLIERLPLDRVARNLGNQVRVTEEYYVGLTHSDFSAEQDFLFLSRSVGSAMPT